MQLPPTILSLNNNDGEMKRPKEGQKLVKKLATSGTKDTKTSKSEEVETGGEMIEDSESDGQSSDSDIKDDTVDEVANQISKGSLSDNGQMKNVKTPVLRPPKTLETTLFDRLERMYGPGIKRMLKIQYRQVLLHLI